MGPLVALALAVAANSKVKRKPRLSKIESYKAANIKEECSFASSFVSFS